MSEADRRSIAEMLLSELLGQRTALEAGGFCACPGVGMHTKGNGKRDFRVVLDGAPTGYCFHGSCSSVVEGFNKELRRRIWFAENGREARAPRHHWGAEVAAEPKAEARLPGDRGGMGRAAECGGDRGAEQSGLSVCALP